MQKYLLLALAVFPLVIPSYGRPQSEQHMGPRIWSTDDGKTEESGVSSFTSSYGDQVSSNVLYAKGYTRRSDDGLSMHNGAMKMEVGVASVMVQPPEFGPVKVESKFLVAGLEAGHGMMGRATYVDVTVGAGPVSVNLGVTSDTGVIFDRGLEAKWLGVGGKVAADGIEVCIVFCLGFSW